MHLCYFAFMRKIMPLTGHVALAAEARRTGLNQDEIARELGISQSQVSRVLAGRTKRDSKVAADIRSLLALRSRAMSPELVLDHPELIEALTAVWDGSIEHGKAIAGVIRSLGALRLSAGKIEPRP